MKIKQWIEENHKGNTSEFSRKNGMTRGAVLHMIRSGKYEVRNGELIKSIMKLKRK